MVETMRTRAEMIALLADNVVGDIGEEDVRDLLETLYMGHAEGYISAASATSFTDSASYVEPAGTWSLGVDVHNWSMPVNARFRYIGVADRIVHVACSLSMTSSNNNQTVWLGVGKNGTLWTPSAVKRKIGTGSDVGSTALHALVPVSTNDYLSVMVRNESWTTAETVTLDLCNMSVMDMPV